MRSTSRVNWTRRVAGAATGHRRKAAIGLVVVLLVAGVASVAVAQLERRFSDVAADDPNRIAIEWAADAGLTVGYGDGTFGPDEAMTSFEAVTFMERFFDLGLAEGFSRGDMMTLLHAINRDLPLLNRTSCAYSGSVNTIGPFVLLEGHHGVEFWITEPDGSKYKGIMAVDVLGEERSRLFPYISGYESELAKRTGEWFAVHRVDRSEWVTMEVFTSEPAKWTLCVTARRLEEIGP